MIVKWYFNLYLFNDLNKFAIQNQRRLVYSDTFDGLVTLNSACIERESSRPHCKVPLDPGHEVKYTPHHRHN
jgi:hypothetical protein